MKFPNCYRTSAVLLFVVVTPISAGVMGCDEPAPTAPEPAASAPAQHAPAPTEPVVDEITPTVPTAAEPVNATPAAEVPDPTAWLNATSNLPPAVRRAVILQRIARHPSEAASLAAQASRLTASTDYDVIRADSTLLDALDAGLSDCENAEQAGQIVTAREAIESDLQRHMASWVRKLIGSGQSFANVPRTALTSPWADEVDRAFDIVETLGLDAPLAEVVQPVVRASVSGTEGQLAASEAAVKKMKAAVESGEGDFAPARDPAHPDEPASGECQTEAENLSNTLALVGDDRLRRWAAASNDAQVDEKLEEFERRASETYTALGRLQMLRYNLWAIGRIKSAETAGNWDMYLSSVDRAALHPATAAMWNLVHDRRFAAVEDNGSRPRIVRTLLTAKPARMEEF